MEYLIYKLIRADGEIYIGTTNTKSYKARMYAHKYNKRFKGTAFEVNVLERSNNISLLEKEEFYIKKYDSFHNGLNETVDGKTCCDKFTTLGMKYSKESRAKISKALKGRIPWNKGKKNCYSENSRKRMSETRKGNCYRPLKFPNEIILEIRNLFNTKPNLENAGKVSRNGRIMSYEQAFSLNYSNQYNMTTQMMRNIITNKMRTNVI